MYDFDSVIDRRSSDSVKWDVKENELPMWVADMDFKAAPEIINAIKDRVEHGIFGYPVIPDEWYEAYIGWWKRRHDFELQKDWLMFCTGVIPAISSSIRKLTTPNENIVVQTPVYNCFFNCIANNGCRVLENPLIYKDNNYSMDFEDLEKKLSDPQTSMMILCNPHNPAGMIWDRESLSKVGALAKKYNVVVISDEIHCDITEPDKGYVPFASVSDDCRDVSITCITPTKAFNMAGMQTSAISVPNPYLRHKVWRAINTDEAAEPNTFAILVAIAALNKGEGWLDEMRQYVSENKKLVVEHLKKEMPECPIISGDATYLLWVDLNALKGDSTEISDFLRAETGLYITDGAIYGGSGNHFLRMNVACPRSLCIDGAGRLADGLKKYKLKNF